MITFWFFALLMVVVALYYLLRPFFVEMKQNEVERSALNVKITKERISELEVELEQGTISNEEYEQSREELEQSLLFDLEQDNHTEKKLDKGIYNRFTRTAFIFCVPIVAISLYFYLGQPDLIEGGKKQTMANAGHGSSGAPSMGNMEQLIDKLAEKLKENPENAEGWYMLGRSYMSLQRYNEAVVALEKTNKLVPNNPSVMLRYADALTMLNGGSLSGKPFELVKKAIALKPNDPTGLWLVGMGYEEQGEYKKAISYWKILLTVLKDQKSIDEVKSLIRRAQKKGNISVAESTTTDLTVSKKNKNLSIKVRVTIDEEIIKKASMDDTVFIFAKAISGPPMPLAVVRKQVKDLPLQVLLDDSMAMTPSMKLSDFEKVQVIARVSKSGSPKSQSGDLQSAVHIATAGKNEAIELTINTVLP